MCYSGAHLGWAAAGGGLGLLLWVAGIPWAAFAVLREKRRQLGNSEVRQRYGFLFNGYKERAYFWESLVMLRKVAVIFVAVFLRSLGTRIQAFTLFLLLLGFLLFTHQRQPFLTRHLNRLELISLGSSAATVYAGFFFLASRPRSDPAYDINKDFALANSSRWMLFLFILGFNIAFMVLWISSVFQALRTKCRVKCPKVYIFCCLCQRESLLAQE